MKHAQTFFALVSLMTLALAGHAADLGAPVTLDSLVQDLGGADSQARIVARQLLPRQSIEAVGKLIPLLTQENAEVSWAAMRVLEDFANQVGVAGREAERKQMTDEVMALLAKGQPAVLTEKALRLLPLLISDDTNLEPLDALLTDDQWNEKARAALIETGTPAAARAVCGALTAANGVFRLALLDALGQMKQPATADTLAQWAKQGTPEERVAALRALAWTGDPKWLPLYQEARGNVSGGLKDRADDATLRLADAMARAGGKWEYAIRVYRDVLKSGSSIALRGAAIAGLGRYGDDTAIPEILAAAQQERDLEAPALLALRALNGNACNQALLEAYPQTSGALQAALLPVLGEKKDLRFLDLLKQATQNPEAALRNAAVDALAGSELPGAVEILAGIASTGAPEDKTRAVEKITALASAMAARGQRDAAGKAYLAMYKAATADDARNQAMDGIKRFPVPESFDVLMQHTSPEEMNAMEPGVMAGIVKAMFDAGKKEEAQKFIDGLLPRLTTPQDLQQTVQFLAPILGADEMAKRLGVIRAWKLVGPFPWSAEEAFTKTHVNEPNIDLAAKYPEGDKTLGWEAAQTNDLLGIVDLMGRFNAKTNATAYAFARIHVDAETAAQIRCGSDDGIKVWVNGQAVHENNIDRGCLPDSDKAEAKLRAGDNDVLVRITQGGGGWNFCLRLTQSDGRTLAFTPAAN